VSPVAVEEKLVVEETVFSVPEGNAITGGEDELAPLPDPDVELLTVPLNTVGTPLWKLVVRLPDDKTVPLGKAGCEGELDSEPRNEEEVWQRPRAIPTGPQ